MLDITQTQQAVVEQEAINALQTQQNNLAVDPVTGNTDQLPEGYNADGTPIEEQGELILGKYKTQEELIAAYQELEKKQVDSTQQIQEPQQQEETEVTTDDNTSVIDYNTFDKEYSEKGELSADSYAKLEKQGFSKEQVDRYIAGQKALAETFTNSLYQTVGGQEGYTNLVTWASTNMPQETIVEYNEALQKGNSAKCIQLLEYMSMKAGTNKVTKVGTASTSNPIGTMKPFDNRNEWMKAQSHPLYGRDAKYTTMIDKRYLASLAAGRI